MTDIGEAAVGSSAGRRRGRSFLGWKTIVLVLVPLVAAAVGGAGYFLYLKPGAIYGRPAPAKEAPLPFYLDIKPFVVSMLNHSGAPHFVQIGASLTLSGPDLGKLVEAMLPEVQDAMRLTVLGFKVEDVTTPAGVDRMRAVMTDNLNRMLLRRLGPERIAGANGGSKIAVRHIYFSTLVVE